MNGSDPEGDVPPTVTCAVCGRPECLGCSVTASAFQRGSGPVAWESSIGNWSERLWWTAIASSIHPQQTFGELPPGSVGRALAFAATAELLAIGSFALAVGLGALALSPEFSLRILSTPGFLWFAGGIVLAWSTLMVALHALWGLCLELGARRGGAAFLWRQGLRFGLYACGWDLLTSPAGVVHGLFTRGFLEAWGPIGAAIRVPRAALRAYLQDYRQLDRAAERFGTRLSILLLGGTVLVFGIGVLGMFIHVLTWMGG